MSQAVGRMALVAGGSGLVGSRLLRVLGDAPEYGRVLALSRRPLSFEHPRIANRVTRFESLEHELRGLKCDDAYCCLGTTRRAAGSEAGFRAVDHDLVMAFARLARQAGAQRFVLVSAAGADPASRFLYLRVKGETEKALETLRFPSLELMQPALLLGARRELQLRRPRREVGGHGVRVRRVACPGHQPPPQRPAQRTHPRVSAKRRRDPGWCCCIRCDSDASP